MLERSGTMIWFGWAPLSVCIAPDAGEHREQQKGEEKMSALFCGLQLLCCASSGFSLLPHCVALWLLFAYLVLDTNLIHCPTEMGSVTLAAPTTCIWWPKLCRNLWLSVAWSRMKICLVPPYNFFKTAILSTFCGRGLIQSLLERNESPTSTSVGFESDLMCLFLLLVQSLGVLPGIHWESFDYTGIRTGSKMNRHKGNELSSWPFLILSQGSTAMQNGVKQHK